MMCDICEAYVSEWKRYRNRVNLCRPCADALLEEVLYDAEEARSHALGLIWRLVKELRLRARREGR